MGCFFNSNKLGRRVDYRLKCYDFSFRRGLSDGDSFCYANGFKRMSHICHTSLRKRMLLAFSNELIRGCKNNQLSRLARKECQHFFRLAGKFGHPAFRTELVGIRVRMKRENVAGMNTTLTMKTCKGGRIGVGMQSWLQSFVSSLPGSHPRR